MANLPDPSAIDSLARVASSPDEVRDVRIAAADALKHYHSLQVARTLSDLLGDRDFSVAWQARRSLVFLTHNDFGYDQASWLGYFTAHDKQLTG